MLLVQRIDGASFFAVSPVRLRSTSRLKTWVSSTPGNFCARSNCATEEPTVPKPSRATRAAFGFGTVSSG